MTKPSAPRPKQACRTGAWYRRLWGLCGVPPGAARGGLTLATALLAAATAAGVVAPLQLAAAAESGVVTSGAAEPQLTDAAAAFDGERALAYTRDLVALGPRPVGSDALERARRYIETTLEGFGLQVERDELVGNTPNGPIEMANLIVEIPAAGGGDGDDAGKAVMIAGHYDTGNFQGFDFVGANDGGSSAGVLIEIGRALVAHPPPLPVWLVFFDGEEAVVRWGPEDSTYGSRHLAARLEQEGRLERIGAMILLDMIGDADLAFDKESTSYESAPWLTDLVWSTAQQIGHGDHFTDAFHAIEDDHLPFARRGVPVIDLIDFQYGPSNRYWHSPFDTMDKLGAGSFQVVGEVVLSVLPALAERF